MDLDVEAKEADSFVIKASAPIAILRTNTFNSVTNKICCPCILVTDIISYISYYITNSFNIWNPNIFICNNNWSMLFIKTN